MDLLVKSKIKDTFQKMLFCNYGIMYILWRLFLIGLLLLSYNNLSSDALKEAKKAYSGRQYQKAVKLFLDYSKTNPQDGEPYMFLGYIYESLKEYSISTAYFRKSVELKLNPKQKKTVLLKLIIYFNYLNAWNYVVHYSNLLLALEPGNPEIEKILGKARSNRGSDHVASVNVQYQERDSKSVKQVDKEKSKTSNSENEVKTTKEVTKTQKIKEREEPDEETELWRNTLRLFEKADFLGANKHILKLLEINATSKEYLYKAGIIKIRLKEYEKSLEYFDNVIKVNNDKDEQFSYLLYLNRGIAFSKLEKYEESIDSLKKSYSYNKSFLPLFIIVRMKYENNDFEDSLKYSNYIYNVDQENIEALMYRAISKLQLNQKKDGFKDLLQFSKKIKVQYPDYKNIPEKFHSGIHYLGVFYSGRKKYKLSNKLLNIVQKTRGSLKSFIFASGKNSFYLKDYEKSVSDLEKLPDVPAASFLISKYYLMNNNIEKTKEYLLKATSKREIYWSRVLIDTVYKSVMQTNSDFSKFIINKGVIQNSPINQPNSTVNQNNSQPNNNIPQKSTETTPKDITEPKKEATPSPSK